jgi:DNA polymerase
VATRALLGTDAPISRLRGRFHDYRGTPVMPTYHPAFLLRHPEKKRETWGDIQKIMGLMEKNSLLTSQGKMV